MATFEKRTADDGTKTVRVKIRLKGRKSVSGTFRRLTDAKRWAAETETEIRNGRYFARVEGQKHTVAELIDRYCAEVLPDKKENTRIGQVPQFKWWKEAIGDYFLSDVTPALLSDCKSRIAKSSRGKRTSITVKRYLAALSHAFTVAVKEWQWVQANPFSQITKPKEPRGRVRYLSDVEREALLKACSESKNPYLLPIVLLAIATGPRKNEILTLKRKDADLDRGAITLYDTKNGEPRSVPVRGRALEELRRMPKRIDSELLFPDADGTRPMKIRKDWEKAVKDAELKDFRFHDLRHSCASYLAMSGATSGEIAAVLGHKTLQMVKRYAHIGEQHTASVLERMNEKILGKTK